MNGAPADGGPAPAAALCRRGGAVVSMVCCLMSGSPVHAQPRMVGAPLDLTVSSHGRAAGPPATAVAPPRRGLAEAIALAAAPGLLQAGVDTARQALVDCQRGDYPGGGLGLLSLPFGTATARTDHCFR